VTTEPEGFAAEDAHIAALEDASGMPELLAARFNIPVDWLTEIKARQARLPLEHHVETFRDDTPPHHVGWHCLTCNEQAYVDDVISLSWQTATAEAAGAEHSKAALIVAFRADAGWLIAEVERLRSLIGVDHV